MSEKKKLSLEGEVYHKLQMFEDSLWEMLRISEQSGKGTESAAHRGKEFIYITLTDDVCRRCPKYRECFGEKREKTLAEIAMIFEKAEKEARVDGRMASGEFRRQCVYFQPFIEEMAWLFRLLYQNRWWENRLQGMRQIMRKQMQSQYLLMQECRRLLSVGAAIEGMKKRKLRLALLRKGFRLLEGRECTDENGRVTIILTLYPIGGSRKTAGVLQALSDVYGKTFQNEKADTWIRSGKRQCLFVEENSFQVIFGVHRHSKAGERVCGDTFSFGNYHTKRAILLLSDGMGAGENAYKDSRKLLETFEAMLEAGIHEEYALEILHSFLLTQEKAEYATLDAAVISLQTGTLKIVKAGGAATFVRRKQSVERILPSALPPGCLPEQRFDSCCKKLYDGDMVIMLSDGMLDFENRQEDALSMEEILLGIKTGSAQQFADALMETVPIPESGRDDDRTVLVAAVWETGRQKKTRAAACLDE